MEWNFSLRVGVSSKFHFIVRDITVLQTMLGSYPLKLALRCSMDFMDIALRSWILVVKIHVELTFYFLGSGELLKLCQVDL